MQINSNPKNGGKFDKNPKSMVQKKKRDQKPIKRGQSIYYKKSNQVNQNQVKEPNSNQNSGEPDDQTFIITDTEVYEDFNGTDFFNDSVLRSSEIENSPNYFSSSQETPISVICEPDLNFAGDGFPIYFPEHDDEEFKDLNVNENGLEPGEIIMEDVKVDLTPKKSKGTKEHSVEIAPMKNTPKEILENLEENEKFMNDLIHDEPEEVKIEKKSDQNENSMKRKRIRTKCCTLPESPISKPKVKITNENQNKTEKNHEKMKNELESEQTSEKPKKKYKKYVDMPATETDFNYQTPSQKYERKLMFEDKSLPPGWFRRLYYRSSGQRSVFSTLISRKIL